MFRQSSAIVHVGRHAQHRLIADPDHAVSHGRHRRPAADATVYALPNVDMSVNNHDRGVQKCAPLLDTFPMI